MAVLRDPPHGIKAISKDQLASQLFEDGAVTLPSAPSHGCPWSIACPDLQDLSPKDPCGSNNLLLHDVR